MTLYLKYRPQTLEDVDHEIVRESLKKIIKSGNIPHAFLFSGPKGVGKTSVARILAKVVNCENLGKVGEPCNKCDSCTSITNGSNLDVIELDAASHRGIDDIRTLRDAVKLAPARAKMKVYIIDEAHMLTLEASNAFLKTLEEPPAHTLFILATTNPEKLIDTIRSRTTQVIFKKATIGELEGRLRKVAKGENFKAEKEALSAIAGASDGSFRDAVKMLEQLVSEGIDLTKGEVDNFIFQKRILDVENFVNLLAQRKAKDAIVEIEDAVSKGISIKRFIENLIARLQSALLFKVGVGGSDLSFLEKGEIIKLIKIFSKASGEIPGSVLEQIPLELAIVKWCEKDIKNEKSNIKNDPDHSEKSDEIKHNDNRDSQESDKSEAKHKISARSDSKENLKNGITEETWTDILSKIRPRNTSTEALLRAAKPLEFDGKILKLGVYYSFHKERLEEINHKRILEDVISQVVGESIRVICTLTEPPPRKVTGETSDKLREHENGEQPTQSDQTFGDTVLTESDSAAAASDPVLTEPDSVDEEIIKVAKEIFGS